MPDPQTPYSRCSSIQHEIPAAPGDVPECPEGFSRDAGMAAACESARVTACTQAALAECQANAIAGATLRAALRQCDINHTEGSTEHAVCDGLALTAYNNAVITNHETKMDAWADAQNCYSQCMAGACQ